MHVTMVMVFVKCYGQTNKQQYEQTKMYKTVNYNFCFFRGHCYLRVEQWAPKLPEWDGYSHTERQLRSDKRGKHLPPLIYKNNKLR